jgi:polysaccharide biosynthesis transport protein
MSILQFLRIIWARRWVIAAATASCVVGALIVVMVLPPRWEAHSRVMLDLVKPDPVTGRMIDGNSSRGYVATQIELIKDYRVAGQVADQIGWLSDPELIRLYQRRPKSDVRDFRRWIAQRVIDRTSVDLVSGSNVLEITYTATRPGDAKAVADALMKAYVDSTLAFRREEARRNAEWFEVQAQKAKVALDEADNAKTTYEKANGIILQDDKTDVDSARLRALASQAAASSAPIIAPSVSGPAPSAAQLAQVDAQIAQASQTLGPNHPELVELRGRRAALASQVAQERAAASATSSATSRAAASAAGASAGALDRAIAAQRARVMAQSDKVERLRQLQAEVDLRRDQYNKTAGKAAEFRQEALVGDTGLTVLGSAVTPQKPVFPNKPLIFLGSLFLGLGAGVLVALLMELFGRRIRGIEDLQSLIDAPLLAVIPAQKNKEGSKEWKTLTPPRPPATETGTAATPEPVAA